MASLPPSPFTALPVQSAETLVVAPRPQASVAAASGPFDSVAPVALRTDEAAASHSSPRAAVDIPETPAGGAERGVRLPETEGGRSIRLGSTAADIPEPTTDGGGPQESPAPGQELCGAGDLDCIGEIFVGARKLNQLPGIFDPAAITGPDELLYVTLKLMDDHRTRDLPEIPAGLWAEFDPLPLFLQSAG